HIMITHSHFHSFPTRRSSDLARPPQPPTPGYGSPTPARPQSAILRRSIYLRSWRYTMASPANRALFQLLQADVFEFRPHRLSGRSEEHTSELQSRFDIVCRLL